MRNSYINFSVSLWVAPINDLLDVFLTGSETIDYRVGEEERRGA